MSKDFGKNHGLVHGAIVTTRKAWGDSVRDVWAKIAHDEEFASKVLGLYHRVMGLVFSVISTFDRDMLNEGWERLEKDSVVKDGSFTPILSSPFKDGEPHLSGKEFENCAKGYHDHVGQRDLEAMLREADKIRRVAEFLFSRYGHCLGGLERLPVCLVLVLRWWALGAGLPLARRWLFFSLSFRASQQVIFKPLVSWNFCS